MPGTPYDDLVTVGSLVFHYIVALKRLGCGSTQFDAVLRGERSAQTITASPDEGGHSRDRVALSLTPLSRPDGAEAGSPKPPGGGHSISHHSVLVVEENTGSRASFSRQR